MSFPEALSLEVARGREEESVEAADSFIKLEEDSDGEARPKEEAPIFDVNASMSACIVACSLA